MDILYFTDTECFSFVAAGQCRVLQQCPGDIIVTYPCWLAFGHVKLSMPESVSEQDCICPSCSDQQQKPSQTVRFLPLAQLNLHTNFIPGSTGFYFSSRQLGHWIIYSFAVHTSSAAIILKFIRIHIRLSNAPCLVLRCWHLRQQIYFPQLSITPSTRSSIYALCCCW